MASMLDYFRLGTNYSVHYRVVRIVGVPRGEMLSR